MIASIRRYNNLPPYVTVKMACHPIAFTRGSKRDPIPRFKFLGWLFLATLRNPTFCTALSQKCQKVNWSSVMEDNNVLHGAITLQEACGACDLPGCIAIKIATNSLYLQHSWLVEVMWKRPIPIHQCFCSKNSLLAYTQSGF